MKNRSNIRVRCNHLLLSGCCASAALLAGCGSSGRYEPPEVGWHVDAIEKVQADRAKTDELVIYRYEWSNGDVLSATGERHLQQIETALAHHTVPPGAAVTIEPGTDPALDAKRQAEIAGRIRQDAPSAPTAVVVAIPRARGIDGEEAATIDADTPRGGQTNGSNGASSGGIGGGLSGGLGGGAGLSGGGL